MKKLTVKDIIENPLFAFYINPSNFQNFFFKKSDANLLGQNIIDEMQRKIMEKINSFEITELSAELGKTDNIVTREHSSVIQQGLIANSKKINPNYLILQVAFMCRNFLSQIERAENGDQKINGELSFANGDIVVIRNGNISIISDSENPQNISQIKEALAEGILVANQYFANEKNKNIGINGIYVESGISERKTRFSYSIKDLETDSKSPMIFRCFNKDKLSELLDKKMISRGVLVRLLSSGAVDKNLAIELMLENKLSNEEIVGKIFKKSNIQGVALDEEISFKSKLLLYSSGKIKIDVLERGVQKYKEENLDLSKELLEISKYYKGNIKKIAELLTHKVLDYSNSMKFLEILETEGIINTEEKNYIEKVMSDFKIDELVNNTENEEVGLNGGGKVVSSSYVPHLTIDPDKRINYLRSIGAVKKLKIRGETLVKDSDENAGKRNSLDGYEVFIIPDKRIAILEKLYEVTRDKNGSLIYRKNKEGNLIPSVNNATYIMPIEMAKELAEKRNKSDLIKSKYVRRANHTLDWISNVEAKMKDLNPDIEFEAKNTKYWAELIRKNYLSNLENRSRE